MKKFLLIIVFGWLGLSALADELKGNGYSDDDYDPEEYNKYQDVRRGKSGQRSGGDSYNELYDYRPRERGDTQTLYYRGRSARTGRYVHRGR